MLGLSGVHPPIIKDNNDVVPSSEFPPTYISKVLTSLFPILCELDNIVPEVMLRSVNETKKKNISNFV